MSIFHRPACYTLLLFCLLYSKSVYSEDTINYFIVPGGSTFVFNNHGNELLVGMSSLVSTIFTCPTNQAFKVSYTSILTGFKSIYSCITTLKVGDPVGNDSLPNLATVTSVEVLTANGQLTNKAETIELDTKIKALEAALEILPEKINERILQAVTPVKNTHDTQQREYVTHAHQANGEIYQREVLHTLLYSEDSINYFVIPSGSSFVFNAIDVVEINPIVLPSTILTCPTNQAFEIIYTFGNDWTVYSCITKLTDGMTIGGTMVKVKSVKALTPSGQLSTKADITRHDSEIKKLEKKLEETEKELTKTLTEKINLSVTPVSNTLGSLQKEHDQHAHEASGEIYQRDVPK